MLLCSVCHNTTFCLRITPLCTHKRMRMGKANNVWTLLWKYFWCYWSPASVSGTIWGSWITLWELLLSFIKIAANEESKMWKPFFFQFQLFIFGKLNFYFMLDHLYFFYGKLPVYFFTYLLLIHIDTSYAVDIKPLLMCYFT